jgi:hypothetical protein
MSEMNLLPKVKRSRLSVFCSFAFILLALGLSGAGFYHFGAKILADRKAHQALIDVKLIDENGHPVAGSVVFINGQEVGLTDSFGEWREYRACKPGSSLFFMFKKNDQVVLSRSLLSPLSVPFELKRILQIQSPKLNEAVAVSTQNVNPQVEKKQVPAKNSYELIMAESLSLDFRNEILRLMHSLQMKERKDADLKIKIDPVTINPQTTFVHMQAQSTDLDIRFLKGLSSDYSGLAQNLILTLRNLMPRDAGMKHLQKTWFVIAEQPEFYHVSEHDSLFVNGNAVAAGDRHTIANIPLRRVMMGSFACQKDCKLPLFTYQHRPPQPGWTFLPETAFEKDIYVAGYRPIIGPNNTRGYWVPRSPTVNVTKLDSDGQLMWRKAMPYPGAVSQSKISRAL